MYLSTRTDIPDGPLVVTFIPGESPFASVDLSDDADLRLKSLADCDRLMVAAATAKRMLETGGKPHGYEAGAGVTGANCVHCGRRKGAEAHAAACACGHEQGSHWEHSEPEGPRKGCGYLGCRCRAYASPAAVLAASIDAGTPVTVEDDSPFADRHHDPDAAWAAGDDEAYGKHHPEDPEPDPGDVIEVCGLPVFGGDPCPLFSDHDPLPGCPGAGERVSLRIAKGAS